MTVTRKTSGGKRSIRHKESASILTMRVNGLTNEQIAEATNRTPNVIDSHLKMFADVFNSVGLRDRAAQRKAEMLSAAEMLALKSVVGTPTTGENSLISLVSAFAAITKASNEHAQHVPSLWSENELRFSCPVLEGQDDDIGQGIGGGSVAAGS